jgi:hypothetical protein
MERIPSRVRTDTEEFRQNRAHHLRLAEELRERLRLDPTATRDALGLALSLALSAP